MKRKQFTKRLLSVLLAVVMLVGVLPGASLAAETVQHVHTAEAASAAEPRATYTYTLKFDGNGEGATNVPETKTETVSDPEYIFSIQPDDDMVTRPGYQFKNWNSKPDGTGDITCRSGLGGAKVTAENPTLTLYAQWESTAPTPTPPTPTPTDPPAPSIPTSYTYSIVYHGNVDDDSVTNLPETETVTTTETKYDFKVSRVTPVREGYDFTHWYKNPECTGQYQGLGWTMTATPQNPTIHLYAGWTEHVHKHVWQWTVNGEGKDSTHSAVCVSEEECGETIVNQPHTWDSGVVTTQPTFVKKGVKTYTCKDCKATYTEEVPVKVPETPTLAELEKEFMVRIRENCKLDEAGNPVPGAPVTMTNMDKWYWPTSEDQYTLGEIVQSTEDGEIYYCDITIKASTIQNFMDRYSLQWEDDTWTFDWMHSDIKQLEDVTLQLACKSTQSWYLTPKYGIDLYVYHTNHSGGMFDDWVDYPEEGVSRIRCEHNIHERTDYYRCNVILERPIKPTLETLTSAFAGLDLTVDGVATALKPESVYISTVFSSDDGWKLRTEIDASMYLGQCRALAKGQDKKPAVFFVYTPNADGSGSSWVLDTTSLNIKTTLNHSWSEWTIDDETHTRSCSECGEVETGAHKWDKGVVTTAPHLDSEGVKTYTCSVCNATRTEVIPVPAPVTSEIVEHANQPKFIYVLENYKAPGKKPGFIGNVNTESSGRQLMDRKLMSGTYTIGEPYEEDGEFYCVVTITNFQPYLDAFQAKYPGVEYVIDAANPTSYQYVLKYVGYDYPADPCCWRYSHMLKDENGNSSTYLYLTHVHYSDEMEITTPATCTEPGVLTGTCQHCYKLNPSTISSYNCRTEFTEEIPATGHTWGEWTADGDHHVRECTVCGDKETEAHKWDKGVVTTAPHLDSEGVKTYTCSVCNATKTEVIPVPTPVTSEIVEHERQNPYIYILENSKPAGQNPYFIGNVNNEKLGRQVTYRGLLPGTYEIGEPYEEDGKFYCIVTITDMNAYLKSFQDKFTDGSYIIDTAASKTSYRYCLEYVGYTNPSSTCTWRMMKALPDENGKDTNRLWITHIHTCDEMEITTPATCTTPGVKTGVCQHCYKVTPSTIKSYNCLTEFTEEIPATGHTWGEWEITEPATCEAEGVKTRTCSGCGDVETETIPAIGHEWDEGKITTEATCTKEGVKTFTCKNDPTHTRTEAIPVTEHTFSEWTTDGNGHARECTVCGLKETGEHIDADENGVCDLCGAKTVHADEPPKTGDLTPVKAVVAGLLFSFAAICAIILDISRKKKYSDQ